MGLSTGMVELEATLRACGQEAAATHLRNLDGDARARLAAQLAAVDWTTMEDWIRRYVLAYEPPELPRNIRPAPYYPLEPADEQQEKLYARAVARGEELIAAGAVAGFTVAGGQGTRLGFDGPKGTYPFSPVKNKTFFQLFAETILRVNEKYGTCVPWYVMTSPLNHEDTVAFFEEHEYFGLSPDNVRFFAQGTLPAIGMDGKVLLAEEDSLALSPNGHGGSLLALRDSGALADMRGRGVRHITYWQVDNALVQMFDPLFIGLHDLNGSEMSSRSLTKTGPFEKLGNFCLSDGRLIIVEYSDMPEELAVQEDEAGRLRFRAGSPAIHILDRAFVERITEGQLKLPLHRAEKKVPCIDAEGNRIEPASPNAVKLEMFIFDALPLAENPLILEADRSEQFGPVKQVEGVDSVQSARQFLQERSARWLEKAGITVPRRGDGALACMIELSPRRFVDEDDVLAQAASLRAPLANAEEYYE